MFPKELNNPEVPLYPIRVVSELLRVNEQTLRVYEKNGLIHPFRKKRDRYYSANDVVWLKCLRRFLKQDGINLRGIERLLRLVPCYSISPCEDCGSCTAHVKRSPLGTEEGAQEIETQPNDLCPHCHSQLVSLRKKEKDLCLNS